MREWNYWTRNKLEILADYLPAFNTASQSSDERLYIDLMAGDPVNRDRDTGQEFDGSARLALSASPGFTKVALCENEPRNSEALRADLAERFPNDRRAKRSVDAGLWPPPEAGCVNCGRSAT